MVYGAQPCFNNQLIAYCDVDYARDMANSKPQSGYVLVLNGGPIDWGSCKQTCTAVRAPQRPSILPPIILPHKKSFECVNYYTTWDMQTLQCPTMTIGYLYGLSEILSSIDAQSMLTWRITRSMRQSLTEKFWSHILTQRAKSKMFWWQLYLEKSLLCLASLRLFWEVHPHPEWECCRNLQ
jgi:hypothetical protein